MGVQRDTRIVQAFLAATCATLATIVCVVAFGPPAVPITWVVDHTLPTRLHSLGDADLADFISQTGWQVGRVQGLGYLPLSLIAGPPTAGT